MKRLAALIPLVMFFFVAACDAPVRPAPPVDPGWSYETHGRSATGSGARADLRPAAEARSAVRR